MQIKKCFSLLLCLLILIGCTNKNVVEDEHIKDSPYITPISTKDVISKFDNSVIQLLKNNFGEPEDAFVDESFDHFSKELNIFDLKVIDYYNNELDLSTYANKKVLIEVAATYCEHCGEQLEYVHKIRESLADDIDIIQIFADRDATQYNIASFYYNNNDIVPQDIIIIPYNYELVDRIVSFGVSLTPTFMFVNNGVCMTSLASFNEKFYKNIISVGFTDKFKRSLLCGKNGESLDEIYRTDKTLLKEINASALDDINSYNKDNGYYISNSAGQYIDFYNVTFDSPDALIKKETYLDYIDQDVVIFGLSCYTEDKLYEYIDIVNEFVDNNPSLKCLVMFLDDPEHFNKSTSELYLAYDKRFNCDTVSTSSCVPRSVGELALTFMNDDTAPMILFIENNYITGFLANDESLKNVNILKDYFFDDNCITLKSNLNQIQ